MHTARFMNGKFTRFRLSEAKNRYCFAPLTHIRPRRVNEVECCNRIAEYIVWGIILFCSITIEPNSHMPLFGQTQRIAPNGMGVRAGEAKGEQPIEIQNPPKNIYDE